ESVIGGASYASGSMQAIAERLLALRPPENGGLRTTTFIGPAGAAHRNRVRRIVAGARLRGGGRERRMGPKVLRSPAPAGETSHGPGTIPPRNARAGGVRWPDARVRAETPAPPVFGKENAAAHVKRGPRCLNPNALLGEGIRAFCFFGARVGRCPARAHRHRK